VLILGETGTGKELSIQESGWKIKGADGAPN
jgi:hypothetical protein